MNYLGSSVFVELNSTCWPLIQRAFFLEVTEVELPSMLQKETIWFQVTLAMVNQEIGCFFARHGLLDML